MRLRVQTALGAGLMALVALVPLAGSSECIWGDCENGRGTQRDSNGVYRSGIWEDRRLVEELPRTRDDLRQERRRGACVSGDCANGRGVYAYADGSVYVGEFQGSQPHGRGSLTGADGNVRVGTWERGRRISRRATTAPARMSEGAGSGCAVGDCRDGRGSYRWSNGSSYTGSFRNFKQHGQGTLVYANGASYVGGWKDGRRHGYGSYTELDGRQHVGGWKNGRYTGPLEAPALEAALTGGGLGWPDLSQPAPAVGGGDGDAAVIVGLQDYSGIADIEGAAENATAWYEYLASTRGVPSERIELLIDEDATREDMRRAAEASARQVGEGGTLWFVFIGHGALARDGKDGLLVGFDAQQQARSIEARSLRRGDLLAVLESSPASSIQVYLDACFSGRSGGGEPLVEGLQPLVVTELEAASDVRTTLLTAARGDEYAGPLPGTRRPAFSYLALGGLRGWADDSGDGLVTALELQSYVEKAIRMLVRDRKQRPALVGSPAAELARSSREPGPDLSKLVLTLSRSR
jgi:hypothetical protein